MDNIFSIEMTNIPLGGGLTGDPSVLNSVNAFLNNTSNREKVNQLLEEDGCIIEYRSLIDCVLAELAPQFKEACFEFYAGNGKPLANLYPAKTIEATDVELVMALEVLISKEWPTWKDFKSNVKSDMKWEPL
ncbi:MAG: hypothetical protein ACLQPD_06500 [Desulfomonilaceae bacterium]